MPDEVLDHHERVKSLIAEWKCAAPERRSAMVFELRSGSASDRRLALLLAAHDRDWLAPVDALRDDSIVVRALAARLIARHAQHLSTEWMSDLDEVTLIAFADEVCRQRRTDWGQQLADSLVARAQFGLAMRLIPVCGHDWVTDAMNLPWPSEAWLRFAKHHPDALCDRLAQRFGEVEEPELVFRLFDPALFRMLARRRPARVFSFIEQYTDPDSSLAHLDDTLSVLAKKMPEAVARLAIQRSRQLLSSALWQRLSRRYAGLNDDLLAEIVERAMVARPSLVPMIFRRISVPRRRAIFAQATRNLELTNVHFAGEFLDSLPTDLRDREASRMLALPRAQADAVYRRELLGHCSITRAQPLLEVEGTASDPDERAQAYVALVHASRRSRMGLNSTLRYLARIKNDQDPVRAAVLGALASVPGRHFDDAAALDAVIAPIFEARDTSYLTRNHASRIAHQLMIANAADPSSPMFALGLRILERLAGQGGTIDLPALSPNLPRGSEHRIVAVLLPWLEGANERQRFGHVARVVHSLGKRSHGIAALDALVERAVWHGAKSHASAAAEMWLRDPKTRDERVRALLAKDRTAVYVNRVLSHCHRRRQSALASRFVAPPLSGRFHDGKVAWIPSFDGRIDRWPDSVQQAYVAILRTAERQPKTNTFDRMRFISMLARVPLSSLSDMDFALHSADVPLIEAALGALVYLDAPGKAPSVLSVLCSHLMSDRARVAMYAMPRLARLIPPSTFSLELNEILRRPSLKVTVQKEAIRLLGRSATPEAVATLVHVAKTANHRDVQIALVHAARSSLHDERSWGLLASLTAETSPDVARALLDAPRSTISEPYRARYLALMIPLADHTAVEVRTALFQSLAGGWLFIDASACVRLGARVIGRCDITDPFANVLTLIEEGARLAAGARPITDLITVLVDKATADVKPDFDRDRISARRLVRVARVIAAQAHRVHARRLALQLAKVLGADARYYALGAMLALSASTNEALANTLCEQLDAAPTSRIVSEVESAACEIAENNERDWSAESAVACVDELVSGNQAARAAASRLIDCFGKRWEWSSVWRERLERLRNDAEFDVAYRALAVCVGTPR
jgi:hypothetical protein